MPMLVIRVETDWYPHETEFRYVLQPGEGINCVQNIPIGQVFFVPREEITVRDCNEEEIATIRQGTGGILSREGRPEADDRLRTRNTALTISARAARRKRRRNTIQRRNRRIRRDTKNLRGFCEFCVERRDRDQASEAATSTMMSCEAEGVFDPSTKRRTE